MTNNNPIETLRDGALTATIWANQSSEGKTFHSVTFGRTYTDDAGNVKNADSFSGSDLLKIARLSGQAYDRIIELRVQNKQREAA